MEWGAIALVVSGIAAAAPRTLTLGAGDCSQADLLTATRLFSSTAAASGDVLPGEAVLERFRPGPTSSAGELNRLLETAQATFYAGAHDKALDAVRAAFRAILRLPPGAETWKLTTRALMLHALVLKAAGKKPEALEAHKRVLRIEPAFQLDADYHPPATLEAFELARQDLLAAKKAKLTITSSPSGAQVFVDGAPLGQTPFAAELPLGSYQLALVHGERRSFTRALELSRDEALQIDIGFEGAIALRDPLCVNGGVEPALKLAALAGAEQLAVLTLETRDDAPLIRAALISVSTEAKAGEAAVRFAGTGRAEAISALAKHLLTGSPSAEEVAALGAAVKPAPPVAVAAPAVPAVRSSTPRLVSYVLMGAGAVTSSIGGAIYGSGGGERTALSNLVDEQGRVRPGVSTEAVMAAQHKVDANTQSTLIFAVSGGAMVASGIAVFFLMPPGEGVPPVAIAPLRDGIWAGTTFSF